MKLTEKKIDELNLEFTVEVAAEDYADKKKKKLSELRRNAEIKGFRKGMVPPALIARMYGERVLVDTVNDAIAEGINDYIRENKLRVVGEPLPADEQPKNEWADGNSFTFVFEAGLNPEVAIELSEADEVPYYTITVAAEAKAEMKKNLLAQYGSLTEAEAAGENDFIIADFTQGETKVEGTYVAIRSISESVRPAFLGIKSGDKLNVNVNEAFENETDRASMLKVSKDELADMNPEWEMSVVKVQTYADAELCQETYDKIFGEGMVNSEEEFDAKIEERLRSEYKGEADFRLQKDMKDFLVEKAALKLPESFLKKWLFHVNDGKFTKEEIEKEYPMFEEDYKWQLVRDFIMQKYDVKVEEADVLASAKGFAAYQFAMYGMANVPDEQLETYARQLLSQEKESRRIVEQVETEKAIDAVKPLVTLKKKKISVAKFRELK